RKVRRLNESSSETGLTLWSAVLAYLTEAPRSRDEVLARFGRDDEAQLRAVLHDLTESGLLFASGSGAATLYRAADDSDLLRLRHGQLSAADGLEELVWVLVYREGPLDADTLARRLRMTPGELAPIAERLIAQGRIQSVERAGEQAWAASDFYVPVGAQTGWEA